MLTMQRIVSNVLKVLINLHEILIVEKFRDELKFFIRFANSLLNAGKSQAGKNFNPENFK